MLTLEDVHLRSDEVVSAVDMLRAKLRAANIVITAFPARRCDERGWHIGQTLNGTLLRDQLTFWLSEHEVDTEDSIRQLVDRLLHIASPILSARPPTIVKAEYVEVEGLIIRFVADSVGIRGDVVIGPMIDSPVSSMPQPE